MDEFRQQLRDDFVSIREECGQVLEKADELVRLGLASLDRAISESTAMVERRCTLQRATADAGRARAERRRAEQQLADAEDRLDDHQEPLEQLQRAQQSALAELTTKTEKYQHATDLLCKLMGIQLRKQSSVKTDGVVRVITLTRLDPADPEKPFHIQYSTKDNHLKLMATKPSIGDLSELQTQLDSSGGDLPACVSAIRRRFQELVQQRAARRQRRAARASAAVPA